MNKESRSTFGFDQFQFLMEKCVLFASPSYIMVITMLSSCTTNRVEKEDVESRRM